MHIRQKIRTAVMAAISQAVGPTGSVGELVEGEPIEPRLSDGLMVRVSIPSEDVTATSYGTYDMQERALSIYVHAFIKSAPGADTSTALDAAAELIERCLSADIDVDGKPIRLIYQKFDARWADTLELDVGQISMAYQTIFYTRSDEPGQFD